MLCLGHKNVVNDCLLVCDLLASDTYSQSIHIFRSGLAGNGLQHRLRLQGLHRFNDWCPLVLNGQQFWSVILSYNQLNANLK